jgi:Fe2+ transport system protein B
MSRKQYAPPAKTHEVKKTRKEAQAELKAEREKFEQEQGVVQSTTTEVEAPPASEPTEDERAQLIRLLIFAVVGTVLLLAFMYWIFASSI